MVTSRINPSWTILRPNSGSRISAQAFRKALAFSGCERSACHTVLECEEESESVMVGWAGSALDGKGAGFRTGPDAGSPFHIRSKRASDYRGIQGADLGMLEANLRIGSGGRTQADVIAPVRRIRPARRTLPA